MNVKLVSTSSIEETMANNIYAEVLNTPENLCAQLFNLDSDFQTPVIVMFNNDQARRLNWKKCLKISSAFLNKVSINGLLIFRATVNLNPKVETKDDAKFISGGEETVSYLFDRQLSQIAVPRVIFIVDAPGNKAIVIADDGRYDKD